MQVIRNCGHLRQFVISNNYQLSDFWKFVFPKQPKQKLEKKIRKLVQTYKTWFVASVKTKIVFIKQNLFTILATFLFTF